MFWHKDSLKLCHSRCVPLSVLARDRWDEELCAFFEQSGLQTALLDELLQIGSVVQLCAFQCCYRPERGDCDNDANRHLIVAGTHLYHHQTGEIIRAVQGLLVAQECENFRDETGLAKADASIIVAGDFNATPETITIQGLRNGVLSARQIVAASTDRAQRCSDAPDNAAKSENISCGVKEEEYRQQHHKRGNLPVEWFAVDWATAAVLNLDDDPGLTHDLCLSSCYDAFLKDPGCEFPLTTYSLGFEGTLDWLFFSSRTLRMQRLWDLYPTETLAPAIPSLFFPSDHVPVVVELVFKDRPRSKLMVDGE